VKNRGVECGETGFLGFWTRRCLIKLTCPNYQICNLSVTEETRGEIARRLAIELSLRTEIYPKREGQGFKTFGEFKRTIGVAGTGKAWHHIVGQTTANLQKFGAEAVHNTGNLIRIEHGKGSMHQEITNFYNSVQPEITGSSNITVREWLGNQSFEEQQDFGIRVIKIFGGSL
jgi:hypothetical protein